MPKRISENRIKGFYGKLHQRLKNLGMSGVKLVELMNETGLGGASSSRLSKWKSLDTEVSAYDLLLVSRITQTSMEFYADDQMTDHVSAVTPEEWTLIEYYREQRRRGLTAKQGLDRINAPLVESRS